MGVVWNALSLGDWLGLAGITITFVQLLRTSRVVRKTRAAVENASLQSTVYNVLVVAPRMGSIESQLEYAARKNDVNTFATLLRSYKYLAAELEGLLHQEQRHSADARVKLQKSLAQVSAAKIPSGGQSINDLFDRTKNVRKAVSEASVATVTLTARLRSDLQPPTPVKVSLVRRLISSVQGSGSP
jgi:hypothetical protein